MTTAFVLGGGGHLGAHQIGMLLSAWDAIDASIDEQRITEVEPATS